MKNKYLLITLVLISTLLFSCKKEQSLSPNEDAAKSQQAGIDFLNNGGQVDVGGNTSSGEAEFMNATIDGGSKSYTSYSYTENGNLISMSGSANSSAISFSLSGIPNAGDVIDLADQMKGSGSYVPGVGIAYTSIDGELTIDSSTTKFLKGSFFFKAKNNNGTDTVAVTSGSFRIAK